MTGGDRLPIGCRWPMERSLGSACVRSQEQGAGPDGNAALARVARDEQTVGIPPARARRAQTDWQRSELVGLRRSDPLLESVGVVLRVEVIRVRGGVHHGSTRVRSATCDGTPEEEG